MPGTIKYLRYDTVNFILGENTVVMENEIIELLQNDEDKDSKDVYIIGDLLFMPYYQLPLETDYIKRVNVIKYKDVVFPSFPGSILEKVGKNMEKDDIFVECLPNALNKSVKEYSEEKEFDKTLLEELSNPDNVLLHLRSGDAGDINEDFFNIINNIYKNFKKIYIIFGIHNHNDFNCSYTACGGQNNYWNSRNSFQNTINSIKKVLELDNSTFLIGNSDTHIALMSCASNLIIHRGGFSTIGSIVCKGNIYYTAYFQGESCKHVNNNWHILMSKLNKSILYR